MKINRKIIFIILIIAAVTVVSGCTKQLQNTNNDIQKNEQKAEINLQATTTNATAEQEQEDLVLSTSTNTIFSSITKNINTSDWQIYRNEEYRFEVKYPKGWRWEDYSKDFKYFKIGFYPPDKKKGWEYIGDIEFSVFKNNQNLSLEEWYREIWNNKKPIVDKYEKVLTKNKSIAIIEYNSPDMFGGSDMAFILCNNNLISIDAVAKMSTKGMLVMINEYKCFEI